MNFSDYTTRYIETILSMKKPATQASANSYIRRANRMFGDVQLMDLSEEFMQNQVSTVAKELSPAATRNYFSTVRSILTRAKKEGLINNVPEPEMPSMFRNKQRVFTREEMARFGATSDLLYLLAETGLRIGEARALRSEDIDYKRLTLSVNRSLFNGKEQRPKTQSSVRTIGISKRLSARLDRPFRFDNEPRETAGVTRFHAFRRGNAQLLAVMGCPSYIIKKRLGHAGDVTDKYISYPDGFDLEWAERLSEVLK